MIPALDYYKMSRNIVCKLLCEHNQLDPCNITIQSSYYISAQSEQMGTGLKKAPPPHVLYDLSQSQPTSNHSPLYSEHSLHINLALLPTN